MTLKNWLVITQNNGVNDPFLKGHGDSRYIYIYIYTYLYTQSGAGPLTRDAGDGVLSAPPRRTYSSGD